MKAKVSRLLRRVADLRILREPLLHFLLVGVAIFGLYQAMTEAPDSDSSEQILVGADDIERLVAVWQKQWQRPPSVDELRGLIADYVREEVLYREALALGLDRDDSVVRRRMAQKFEFLSEDLAALREPTTTELAAYFDANRDRYIVPRRVSFAQIYFSPDRRSSARQDADVTLASLRSGALETVAAPGDSSMLDEQHIQKTPKEIEAIFGRDFAEAVMGIQPGIWSGPIASGYGFHLVRVDERIDSRLPELAEVEAQVRADWAFEQRVRANDAIFQRLLANYTVVIEEGMPGTSGLAQSGTGLGQPQ